MLAGESGSSENMALSGGLHEFSENRNQNDTVVDNAGEDFIAVHRAVMEHLTQTPYSQTSGHCSFP